MNQSIRFDARPVCPHVYTHICRVIDNDLGGSIDETFEVP